MAQAEDGRPFRILENLDLESLVPDEGLKMCRYSTHDVFETGAKLPGNTADEKQKERVFRRNLVFETPEAV
jgi:hypothetical protein